MNNQIAAAILSAVCMLLFIIIGFISEYNHKEKNSLIYLLIAILFEAVFLLLV